MINIRAIDMNTRALLINTLVLSALLAVSVPMFAQENAPAAGDLPEISDEERAEFRKEFRKMMHHKGKKMREHRLQELDQNGDEKVDLNEFLANAEQRFNDLDIDSDGFVTKEEARERHKQLRKEHKQKRKQMMRELQQQDDES